MRGQSFINHESSDAIDRLLTSELKSCFFRCGCPWDVPSGAGAMTVYYNVYCPTTYVKILEQSERSVNKREGRSVSTGCRKWRNKQRWAPRFSWWDGPGSKWHLLKIYGKLSSWFSMFKLARSMLYQMLYQNFDHCSTLFILLSVDN